MPPPWQRLEIELGPADESEIIGMYSIFTHAFPTENDKLSQIMYAGRCSEPVFIDIVRRQLQSRNSKFIIAFDTREDFDEVMSYGWMSVSDVSLQGMERSFAASDFSVFVALEMLATEARDRGENLTRLNASDPRVRLACELRFRSRDGQARFVAGPHLVINSLVMWPDTHNDSKWEMSIRLLGWAVRYAERHNLPVWTQVPVGQIRFFSHSVFEEVGRFTVNLNHYAPSSGLDWGAQEWVQMVYRGPRERRARSTSPEARAS